MFIISLPILLYCRFFPIKNRDFSFGLVNELGLDTLLKTKDWRGFEMKIQGLSAGDLTKVLDGIGLSNSYHKSIIEYCKSNDSELSLLLEGVHNTFIAWEIRTGQRAKDVSQEGWEGFYEYLKKANDCLIQVTSTKKLVIESKARLIRVCMGMGEKEYAQELFNQVKEMENAHFLSHKNLFGLLTSKWLGSESEMESFVNSIENAFMKYVLKLIYYLELFSDLYYAEEEEEAKRIFIYEYGNQVQQLLEERQTNQNDSIEAIYANNYRAYLYNILDEKKQRNLILKSIKRRITLYPWAYFGMHSERDINLFKIANVL